MAETSSPSPASSGKMSTESTASQPVHSEQTRLSHTVTPRATTVPTGDSSDDDADRGQSLCGDESFMNGTEQAPCDEETDAETNFADSSEYSKSLNHSFSNSGTATNLNSDTSEAASSSSAANAKDVLSKYAVSCSASIARDPTSLSLSRAANGHPHTELLEPESPNQHQYRASKRPRLSPNANNTRPETKSSAIDPSIEAPAAGRSSVQSVAVTISVEDQVQEKSNMSTVRQKNDNIKILKARSDEHHNVKNFTHAEQNDIVSTKRELPLSGSPSTKLPGIVNTASTSFILSPHANDQSSPTSSIPDDTVPELVSYESDPLHYDGDALLRHMVHRCVVFFEDAGDKGFLWIQCLNRTRVGSNEAPAITQKLCELAENNETLHCCASIQVCLKPDECYWIQERLQIHTYQDACYYYGTLPRSADPVRGRKRKLADLTVPETSKRAKIPTDQLRGSLPSSTWHYPSTYVTVMMYAIYPDKEYATIGCIPPRIDAGAYKTLRHGMISVLKLAIDRKPNVKKVFTSKPDYVFSVKYANGETKLMQEWDFVHFDREIARGNGLPGVSAMIIKAWPPGTLDSGKT
ncbi:hypothetical protein LTR70_006164 [Exophiala xenobiotica]|uniref:Uncharacterized protein n=1 Tax=Lithohypha guttulata TaxID=1690604 RepID=A0ABR0K7R6_9EURO|nr:hypothetical protein LTR24_005842 [Lithohypha guttulata]KAK5316615.1 hypothetical protein LTR70_006164 [Exophiala xenobiotica]